MKTSRFNFFVVSTSNKCYIYNSMTNCLLNVDSDIFKFLSNCGRDKIIDLPHDFFDKETIESLFSANILTDSDQDEIDLLHLKFLTNRFDKSKMTLTLVPTQACNFNCTYCYEHFRPNISMEKTTEDNIIKFITQANPNSLHLTWYGGEPLMNFNSIQNISTQLKLNNINFDASIVTNGYLLKEGIIDQLQDLNITSIQVTLDGPEDIHDSRRFLLTGKPSFKIIYKNIESLLSSKASEKILLKIRVNVDKSNIQQYSEFRQSLINDLNRYNRKIFIYPGWVTGETNPDTCCLTNNEISEFVLENSANVYPQNGLNECMVRHINSYLIGPTGKLYKCWHNLGHEEFELGNINDQPQILNSKLLSRFIIGTDPYLHAECKQCSILPICWGGCPMERYENAFKNSKHNTCIEYKNNMEAYILKHINKIETQVMV